MKRLLLVCGTLAAGEYLASFVSGFAELWPAVALLTALVALFGYGFFVRGWPMAFVFLLGFVLYLQASVSDVQLYRERPWMREVKNRRGQSEERRSACAWRMRKDLSRRMSIGLAKDDETVALSRAILLGERRRVPSSTLRVFVESGAMHVFAVSGLHVMSIAELLACGLLLLAIPRRFAGTVAVPLLWGYVWMIGWPPSAIRAAMMATFSAAAPVFWRRPDGLRSWALTFLVVHLVSPRMIVNVGSVLSFVVMLAIVFVGELVRNLPRWKQSLCVTVAAWAVGVPIAAHVFGRVTPGGLLSNLVLLAAARAAVVSGALGLAFSSVSTVVAAHLNNLMSLAVRAMVLVADAVTRMPGANFETGQWTLLACIGWYGAVALAFAAIWGVARRSRWL